MERVQPGDPIRAATINDVIETAERAATRPIPKQPSAVLYAPKDILVKNSSAMVLNACEPFQITGLAFGDLPIKDQIKSYMTCGAILTGAVMTSSTPAHKIGVLKESVKPGNVGRCNVPGLTAGKIFWADPTHEYIGWGSAEHPLTTLADSTNALFRLVCGTRDEETNEGFGLFVKIPTVIGNRGVGIYDTFYNRYGYANTIRTRGETPILEVGEGDDAQTLYIKGVSYNLYPLNLSVVTDVAPSTDGGIATATATLKLVAY